MDAVRAIIVLLAWLGALGGAAIGVIILVTGFAEAKSAPQEAVIAALACACAILPYCAARGITEILKALEEAAAPKKVKANERPTSAFNYQKLPK